MEEPLSERPRLNEMARNLKWHLETPDLLNAADFMSRDSDRRVFNRFDGLRLFVLLRLQHQLAGMATRLELLRREQDDRYKRGEIDQFKDNDLHELALEIGPILKEYGMRALGTEKLIRGL